MTPAETRAALVEAMARVLHAEDIGEVERTMRVEGIAPPERWADPWRPGSERQLVALRKRAQRLLRGLAPTLTELGLKIVPVEATEGLLISMALRMDHAFGMPDMGAFEYRKPNIRAWQDARLAELRKAHEEVVGAGFYSPEREADYVAMLAAAPDVLGGGDE